MAPTDFGRPDRMSILERVFLGAALILGLALRLYGSSFDLPYLYNPDEPSFVRPALRMLRDGTLNPGWFGHPGSTTIYVNALIYKAILEFGKYAGWFADVKQFQHFYYRDPTLFYLLPRIFYGLVGTAIIAATFLAARPAFGSSVAVAAALLVAVTPMQVSYSHLIRTDVLASLLILLIAWQAAKIVYGRPLRQYLLAGALTGVAVATKYPAVVVAVLVPFSHCLVGRGWMADWWKLVLAGLVALAAAFVISPFLFLDFVTVLEDVQREMAPTHLSATGEGFLRNLWWYIDVLRNEFGLPILILAAAGACAVVLERRKPGIVLLLFPLLFLAFISSLSLRWARWIVPLLPFMAIFAAGGAAFLIKLVLARCSPFPHGGLLLALAVIASAPLAYKSWQETVNLTEADTRTVARQWILENIDRGVPLLMEVYTPQLPHGAYQLFESKEGKLVAVKSPFENVVPSFTFLGNFESLEDLKRCGIRYVVLSSGFQRFQKEADRYPSQVRNYERLLALSDVVYRARPGREAARGPQIRVLKVDQEALARYLGTGKADTGDDARRDSTSTLACAGG